MITPPIPMRGLFTVGAPFSVTASVIYSVEAVRSIPDMLQQNDDPLNEIYLPAGLTEEDYNADVKLGVYIVTLLSEEEAPRYIPTTYILTIPDDTAIPYGYIVMSANLGALPATASDELTQATQEVQDILSDLVGVPVEVKIATAPSSGSVSYEQYLINEAQRKNAIKSRETVYAQNITLLAENAKLKEVIAYYEQRVTNP